MKRGRKGVEDEDNRLVKTTIFLPEAMCENLAFMAMATRQTKADIVRDAIAKLMEHGGYQPFSKPRLPDRPEY